MVLEIDKNDYSNLVFDYSEENTIPRIQGKEYLVDTASVTNFEIIPNANIDEDGVITPSRPSNQQLTRWSKGYEYFILFSKRFIAARYEIYYMTGSFYAELDEVVYDKSKISVNYEIDYDSYLSNDNLMTEANFATLRPLILNTATNLNQINKDTNGNRYPQIVKQSLFNTPDAMLYYRIALDIWPERVILMSHPTFDISISELTTDSVTGKTIVKVDYNIPQYYGWTDYSDTFFGSRVNRNYSNLINSIKFNVTANTINVIESDFDYGDKSKKPYKFETNELLQFENGQSVSSRMSFTRSNEIFEKTDKNRMIITFDLHRLEKYDLDENLELRYITVGDKIRLKDENGVYLGVYYDDNGDMVIPEFEVIKSSGIWDGRFYKKIIAREVYV